MPSAHQPIETAADSEQFTVAASCYERMRIAAAKLAVAAGATPAEAQRASGLHRVEIKRAIGAVRRQTIELDKAAVLAGDQIPRHLIDPEQVLSGQAAATATDYLQICNYARGQRCVCLYRKAVDNLNHEFNKISTQYFARRDQFEHLSNNYDLLGQKIDEVVASNFSQHRPSTQLMQEHVRNFSWIKRKQIIKELRSIVQQRDSLRAQLSKASGQLTSVMADYQRHHARRAYFRSEIIREYRDYASLFVPRATLYGMHKYDFDVPIKNRPEDVARMLQLAEQWNQIQTAYAAEWKKIKTQHHRDESNDHALYRLIQTNPANSR